MNFSQLLHNLVYDYTIRTVTMGSALIGIFAGAIGVFAVLRKQSLLGDTVSHSTLPGIAIAFLILWNKNFLLFIFGAIIAGWLSMLFVNKLINGTRIKSDSALGISLSVFFGIGLVIISYIQKQPGQAKGGIMNWIFGQAATMIMSDVYYIFGFGLFALIIVSLFWKELKLLTFNPEFGSSMGFKMHFLEHVVTTVIVIAIVIGLQNVGVILMAALIVTPATSARQWTDRLGLMTVLAAIFGGIAGVSGSLVSALNPKIPTGPSIVVSITFILIISIFFAPNRGLIFSYFQSLKNKRKIRTDKGLIDLFEFALGHEDSYGHSAPLSLLEVMHEGKFGVKRTLTTLEKKGYVKRVPTGDWKLTRKGFELAESLAKANERRYHTI